MCSDWLCLDTSSCYLSEPQTSMVHLPDQTDWFGTKLDYLVCNPVGLALLYNVKTVR